MQELTERQARAALAAMKEFKSTRELDPRRWSASSFVYGMSVHIELLAWDYWLLRVQLPGVLFRTTGGDPQAAVASAIAILGHRLGLDQPKKHGPRPGPRQPKDGRTPWADTELACMRLGVEALLADVSVKEATQRAGGASVRITTLPGPSWTAVAKVVGRRSATLVAKGATRAEALRRLAMRS